MNISMIVAIAENGVIGIENRLPWRLPNDLKNFKALTLGKPVIMGRKTWESLGGKPLPNRPNWVLTRQTDFHAEGAQVGHSPEQILAKIKQNPDFSEQNEIMVMGGAEIYAQFMPFVSTIYLTLVFSQAIGDTFFKLDLDKNHWREVAREHHLADEKHSADYAFITYRKV